MSLIMGLGLATSSYAFNEGKQSFPIENYNFSDLEGPVTDPDSVKVEDVSPKEEDVSERARREEFEAKLRPLGECNSCAGSAFTPSFTPLLPRMKGTWAYPECNDAEDVLTQSDYFSLWHGGGDTLCLDVFRQVDDWGQFYSVETQVGETYVEVSNDGLMRIGVAPTQQDYYLRRQRAQLEKQDLDQASVSISQEYTSCAFYPRDQKEKVAWFIDFLKPLDRMVDICMAGQVNVSDVTDEARSSCHKFLFETFDLDQSGALNFREVGRAFYRSVVAHDSLSQCISALESYQKNLQKRTQLATSKMIMVLDQNSDDELSFNELLAMDQAQAEAFAPKDLAVYIGLLQRFPFLQERSEWSAEFLKQIQQSE